MKTTERKLFVCLVSRRERWGLTWRGRFLVALGILLLLASQAIVVHPFLALTCRVPGRLLVIEGWSPPSTMKQAAAEFASGRYEKALLVRPILSVSDQYESGLYHGQWMSQLLVAAGIPAEKLTTLFPMVAERDRTYHSALAVKHWLLDRHLDVDALNVATSGPHSRRTRLLFQAAFGTAAKVGVIAMRSPEYDPRHWWRTSEGVREVIGESIAYLYARLLFHPSGADGEALVLSPQEPKAIVLEGAGGLIPAGGEKPSRSGPIDSTEK